MNIDRDKISTLKVIQTQALAKGVNYGNLDVARDTVEAAHLSETGAKDFEVMQVASGKKSLTDIIIRNV